MQDNKALAGLKETLQSNVHGVTAWMAVTVFSVTSFFILTLTIAEGVRI